MTALARLGRPGPAPTASLEPRGPSADPDAVVVAESLHRPERFRASGSASGTAIWSGHTLTRAFFAACRARQSAPGARGRQVPPPGTLTVPGHSAPARERAAAAPVVPGRNGGKARKRTPAGPVIRLAHIRSSMAGAAFPGNAL
jgi:hypothetical protein